jgi:selenocysteine lyase/cysteine desulfurase
LQAVPHVTLYGITNPTRFDQRAPTVAFTLEGYTPRQVAERLGQEGIFVWDGNYYALAVTERLGVEKSSGSRVLPKTSRRSTASASGGSVRIFRCRSRARAR